jgi:hypothetical protein
MTDVRLIQVARIYGLARDETTDETARAAINNDPRRLAEALFEEATASDDVISEATALEYLEGRFAFLGDVVGDAARDATELHFRVRLQAWLDPPGPA